MTRWADLKRGRFTIPSTNAEPQRPRRRRALTFPAEADDARSSAGRPDETRHARASRGGSGVDRLSVRSARRRPRARARVVPDRRARVDERETLLAPRWRRSAGRRGFRTRQESSPARRRGQPVEESRPCLLPPSSFRPFDECRRDLVADDHDAQDTIVAQHRRGPEPGCFNRRVTSRRRGQIRRRPAPHRGYQSEHIWRPDDSVSHAGRSAMSRIAQRPRRQHVHR